ncbi:MAG: PHP domain-containing protein [Chloroflexi bacterium]|nr:PHP domain-containing protein [Chloroflexota bacterium]
MTFTHLQVHSHYSLLEATATIDGLVAHAAAANFTHLPLTDSNALYGALLFAKACRKVNIQPIIGMTVTVASPEDNTTLHMSGPPDTQAGRLVLLATGPEGYRSLCRLSSVIQGHPERETIIQRGVMWDDLKAHRAGLICLSGGRRGWLERFMRRGDRAAAGRYAAKLGGIYGDKAFLSLEIHHPDDESLTREIAALGTRFGLPVVAAQPIYCLTPDEAVRLPLMAAMDRNCLLEEVVAAGGWPLAAGADMLTANGQRPTAFTQPSALSPQYSFHWLPPTTSKPASTTCRKPSPTSVPSLTNASPLCPMAAPSGPSLTCPKARHRQRRW